MPTEWEEYRPVPGEMYSPGTQWFDSVAGVWEGKFVGTDTKHSKLLDHVKFRRSKQTAEATEVQQLKAAVKKLAESLALLCTAVEYWDKEDWVNQNKIRGSVENVLSDLS